MRSIVFIAPPAAGKGTQSVKLREKYGIPHISAGALLREAAIKDEHIRNELALGHLIDNRVTIKLLKDRLSQSDCDNGYILDGYPRTAEQAEAYEILLKELNKDLGVVILLEIDYENAKSRIAGRLSCNKCGSVYNDEFPEMAPKVANVCDKCGSELSKRSDDNVEAFETRYNTYLTQTKPLIEFYDKEHILHRVNSGINPEYTFSQIEKIIND